MKRIKESLADQTGGTAIEYGLIAGFMGLGIIASLTQVKDAWFILANDVKNGFASK